MVTDPITIASGTTCKDAQSRMFMHEDMARPCRSFQIKFRVAHAVLAHQTSAAPTATHVRFRVRFSDHDAALQPRITLTV